MTVGILTQPLFSNYGGILQAYALQTALKRMGHEPWILRRVTPKERLLPTWIRYGKWLVLRYIKRRRDIQQRWTWPSVAARHVAHKSARIQAFVAQAITPKTGLLYSTSDLRRCVSRVGVDAVIVGSDQVWRPCYSPCLENYFLDFLSDDSAIKRIAYAASFGVDAWEFTAEQTTRCAGLSRKFDAVSVREASAVRLCAERFSVKASHVLDPTMLLSREDYTDLLDLRSKCLSKNELFAYLLDCGDDKRTAVERVARQLDLAPHYFMQDCGTQYPCVTSWLQGIANAKFVVTDSFHGCVFSLIFGRPFLLYNNHTRGLTRFDSLFRQFGLESERIEHSSQIQLSSLGRIDWNMVSTRMLELQNLSRGFLMASLHQ